MHGDSYSCMLFIAMSCWNTLGILEKSCSETLIQWFCRQDKTLKMQDLSASWRKLVLYCVFRCRKDAPQDTEVFALWTAKWIQMKVSAGTWCGNINSILHWEAACNFWLICLNWQLYAFLLMRIILYKYVIVFFSPTWESENKDLKPRGLSWLQTFWLFLQASSVAPLLRLSGPKGAQHNLCYFQSCAPKKRGLRSTWRAKSRPYCAWVFPSFKNSSLYTWHHMTSLLEFCFDLNIWCHAMWRWEDLVIKSTLIIICCIFLLVICLQPSETACFDVLWWARRQMQLLKQRKQPREPAHQRRSHPFDWDEDMTGESHDFCWPQVLRSLKMWEGWGLALRVFYIMYTVAFLHICIYIYTLLLYLTLRWSRFPHLGTHPWF